MFPCLLFRALHHSGSYDCYILGTQSFPMNDLLTFRLKPQCPSTRSRKWVQTKLLHIPFPVLQYRPPPESGFHYPGMGQVWLPDRTVSLAWLHVSFSDDFTSLLCHKNQESTLHVVITIVADLMIGLFFLRETKTANIDLPAHLASSYTHPILSQRLRCASRVNDMSDWKVRWHVRDVEDLSPRY